MPELPEVEICRRQLARWVAGGPLHAVHLPDPAAVRTSLSTRPRDALPGAASALPAAGEIGTPVRHGKRLGWQLGATGVLHHLGMTGRWVRCDPGAAPPEGARIGVETDRAAAWFVDRRRFGCMALATAPLAEAVRAGLGPDALAAAPDGPALKALLPGRRAVKVALLDQARIAGLGNIHAAEALWRARVDPFARCTDVSDAAWARLAVAIGAQLAEAIERDDHDDFAYVTDGGPNPFAVYKRERCGACGGAVSHATQGGRTTWWCPSCQ